MAIKDFIKVLEDNKARYDFDNHRYVLEVDFASYVASYDLITKFGSIENTEAVLEKVSEIVYTYILSFKKSEYREKMLYFLSHSKSAREQLIEIMGDVVFYGLQEGGWAMAYVTGINLQEVDKISNIDETIMVGMVSDTKISNAGFKRRNFLFDFNVLDSEESDRW